MDRSTVVGICLGVVLVVAAIALGPDPLSFLDLPSALIVFGGTAATTLIKFPAPVCLGAMRVARHAFVTRVEPPSRLVRDIGQLAEAVRRDSLLALERGRISDPFLRRATELALDGLSPDAIEAILRSEVAQVIERHDRGQRIFRGMGQSAPAFGMVGTLIGLVQMLTQMDDPSRIGGSMAVALLTTFYGALSSFLFFNPIADKLAERSREELLGREIVIQGILSILTGHHPRVVERRLFGLLDPSTLRGRGASHGRRRAA